MAAHAFDLMTLLDAPGVGPGRVRQLLKHWRNTPEVPVMEDRLIKSVLTPAQIAALPECRDRVKRHWDELLKQNVSMLSIIDSEYPEGLRNALGESAPVLLLCLGNIELLNRVSVGFCGSREASEKGMATARDSATLLANEKINIVSGFAAGVDMNAHRAALAAGGTTTVVLAEGILRFRVKKDIRALWDDSRTLVVSEFGPNLPWSVSHAMQRNKTICGLSRAMVLIEARSTGGSVEAGRDCLRMGLPLFAAVYEGSPESATGNEELLRNGAKRLMKSRSRDLPNMAPVLAAIANPPRPSGSAHPEFFLPVAEL
ncbi:MAG TPA: DNA-processing protein DprA [Bryobacteraceae bacterium]|nr:DNA-processing protein DprA [Bryobacteraceae bacterium]